MASLVARLWMKLCKKRPVMSVMIVGLDNSGKSSILNNLTSLNRPALSQESVILSKQQQSSSSNDNKFSSPPLSDTDTTTTTTTTRLSTTNTNGRQIVGGRSAAAASFHKGGQQTSSRFGKDNDGVSPTVGYNYERIHYKGLTFTALDFSGQNRYRNLWQEFYNCVDAIVFVIDSSDLIRLVVVRDELETLLSHPYFGTLTGSSGQSTASDLPQQQQHRQQQQQPNSHSQSPLLSSSSSSSSTPSSSSLIGAQKQLTLNNQGKLIQSPLDQSSSSGGDGPIAAAAATAAGTLRRRLKIPILFLANKSDLANSVDIEIIVRALNLNQLPKSRHPWFIQATSVKLNQGIGEGFDWLACQLSTNNTTLSTTPEHS